MESCYLTVTTLHALSLIPVIVSTASFSKQCDVSLPVHGNMTHRVAEYGVKEWVERPWWPGAGDQSGGQVTVLAPQPLRARPLMAGLVRKEWKSLLCVSACCLQPIEVTPQNMLQYIHSGREMGSYRLSAGCTCQVAALVLLSPTDGCTSWKTPVVYYESMPLLGGGNLRQGFISTAATLVWHECGRAWDGLVHGSMPIYTLTGCLSVTARRISRRCCCLWPMRSDPWLVTLAYKKGCYICYDNIGARGGMRERLSHKLHSDGGLAHSPANYMQMFFPLARESGWQHATPLSMSWWTCWFYTGCLLLTDQWGGRFGSGDAHIIHGTGALTSSWSVNSHSDVAYQTVQATSTPVAPRRRHTLPCSRLPGTSAGRKGLPFKKSLHMFHHTHGGLRTALYAGPWQNVQVFSAADLQRHPVHLSAHKGLRDEHLPTCICVARSAWSRVPLVKFLAPDLQLQWAGSLGDTFSTSRRSRLPSCLLTTSKRFKCCRLIVVNCRVGLDVCCLLELTALHLSRQSWSSGWLLALKAPLLNNSESGTSQVGKRRAACFSWTGSIARCKRVSNCSSQDCSICISSTAACIPLRYFSGRTSRPSRDRMYSPARKLDCVAHVLVLTWPYKNSWTLNGILTRSYQRVEIWHIELRSMWRRCWYVHMRNRLTVWFP